MPTGRERIIFGELLDFEQPYATAYRDDEGMDLPVAEFTDPEFLDPDLMYGEWGDPEYPERQVGEHEVELDENAPTTNIQLTSQAFWQGSGQYRKEVYKIGKEIDSAKRAEELGMGHLVPAWLQPSPQRIVMDALKHVIAHIHVSRNRPTHRITYLDRIQNGNAYISTAIWKYRPERNVPFYGYIKPCLDQNIVNTEKGGRKGINQGDLIRIPEDRAGYYKIRELKEQLHVKFGQELSLEEVLDFGSFTAEEVNEYKEAATVEVLPFEVAFSESAGVDMPANPDDLPDAIAISKQSLENTKRILELLPQRDAAIIDARLGLGKLIPETLEKIADNNQITIQRVQQIKNESFDKLRLIPNLWEALVYGEEPDTRILRARYPLPTPKE